MKKFYFLFLFTSFISSYPVLAQGIRVQGKVIDKETKEPLIGASVIQKGSTKGTATDVNGNFSIQTTDNAVLVVSYIGYFNKEVMASPNNLTITLSPNDKSLEEVVVVGYGSQKAKDLTAPIATIKGSELTKQTTPNPMSALQGRVAGVQVTNTGAPGVSPSVKIRGVGSIGDYANPLYVVDGVFVDNIDFLSNNDIEDLTILKDASAAAIYGVRAANGVILVTTKKGMIDRLNVSYDGYVGGQIPVNIVKLTNTQQYITLINEANQNTSNYTPLKASSYPASVDWYNELLRNAFTQSHNVDISGASEKTNYSFGANYYYQDGIMKASNNYSRINLRGKVDQKVNNWLTLSANTVISNFTQNIANNEAFFKAYVSPPTYPVYDNTNTDAYPVNFGSPQDYGYGASYANPLAIAYYNNNKQNGLKTVFSTFAEINIIPDKLKFKTNYNLFYNSWTSRNYTPEYYVGGSQGLTQSSLSKTFGVSYRHIIDNLLTYSDKMGKSAYTVMLGQSTRAERKYQMTGTALNVSNIDEQSLYLSNGSATNRSVTDNDDVYGYNGLSAFTRCTYNYNDKYMASFTFRADGSSKYQQKWGYFPSIGLGWAMSSENFMKKQRIFDNLKLRLSWGKLGNDNVPSNSAVILGTTGMASSAVFGNDNVYTGVGAQTVKQNYLKWEVVNELNVGFDFTLLKRSLAGTLDYYHRITNNVVFSAPVAAGAGTANLLGNYGSVLNQGIELTLNYSKKISNDLSYRIGMNATTINNRVLTINNTNQIVDGLINGSYSTKTAVGHPIGSFYGYEIEGIYADDIAALSDPVVQSDKKAGYFKYKDLHKDGVIDDKDKTYLGSAIPWLIAGADFSLNYKNFDFGLMLQSQVGNKVLNAKRMNRGVFADGNYDLDFYNNRWTNSKHSNKYPSTEALGSSFAQQTNSFFVEDASYIRIQNIQLGYTFTKIKGINKIRLYISAERPYTYFTYNGFTPEVSGSSPITSGIDTNTYPMQATYSVGLNVNF